LELAKLDERQRSEMTVAVDRANLDQAEPVRYKLFKKGYMSSSIGMSF
jgi:hypothetical protein